MAADTPSSDQHDARHNFLIGKLEGMSKTMNKNHLETCQRLTVVETKISSANGVVGHVITLGVAVMAALGIKLGIKG